MGPDRTGSQVPFRSAARKLLSYCWETVRYCRTETAPLPAKEQPSATGSVTGSVLESGGQRADRLGLAPPVVALGDAERLRLQQIPELAGV
jgi:hypothetical protein